MELNDVGLACPDVLMRRRPRVVWQRRILVLVEVDGRGRPRLMHTGAMVEGYVMDLARKVCPERASLWMFWPLDE